MFEVFPEFMCGFVVGFTYVDEDAGLDDGEKGLILEFGILRLVIIYHD